MIASGPNLASPTSPWDWRVSKFYFHFLSFRRECTRRIVGNERDYLNVFFSVYELNEDSTRIFAYHFDLTGRYHYTDALRAPSASRCAYSVCIFFLSLFFIFINFYLL